VHCVWGRRTICDQALGYLDVQHWRIATPSIAKSCAQTPVGGLGPSFSEVPTNYLFIPAGTFTRSRCQASMRSVLGVPRVFPYNVGT